jgi:L-serine dehydratase
MTVSVFDLFAVGIGPSSSHTVGPMKAACNFVSDLASSDLLRAVVTVNVDLYGSLAATAIGHGTLAAVLLGLEGYWPESIDGDEKDRRTAEFRVTQRILLGGKQDIALGERDITLHPSTVLDFHPNGVTFSARSAGGQELYRQTYFSVGGGFVVAESEIESPRPVPNSDFSFDSAAELLDLTARLGISIAEVMLRHETSLRRQEDVRARLLHIRDVMTSCYKRGMSRDGVLPGGLNVKRRARPWYERLLCDDPHHDPVFAEDWVNLVALAVNEENASGGRVVTAPTNGAAGIVPAVLYYALHYTADGAADPDGTTVRFLLTSGAIGSLCKQRASISGAEVGCQGEVGSAASMAAAGLAEVLGATPAQVENAAEIAMEHSLGLTCDPIGGLVQIPCIERNAISAGKAINAARMALRGDGTHRVSLDQVIDTMRSTGRDMSSKYKETSMGGLAVNVPLNVVEC